MKTQYTISNVKPLKTKTNGMVLRFALTETKPDGSSIKLLGCLAGVREDGYWTNPPRGAYNHIIITWNKRQEEIVLMALKNAGLLDMLPPPVKEESLIGDIEFEE